MWKDDGNLIFETEDDARDNLWQNLDLYKEDIAEFLEARRIGYLELVEVILTGSKLELSEIQEAINDAFKFLFNEYYSEIKE